MIILTTMSSFLSNSKKITKVMISQVLSWVVKKCLMLLNFWFKIPMKVEQDFRTILCNYTSRFPTWNSKNQFFLWDRNLEKKTKFHKNHRFSLFLLEVILKKSTPISRWLLMASLNSSLSQGLLLRDKQHTPLLFLYQKMFLKKKSKGWIPWIYKEWKWLFWEEMNKIRDMRPWLQVISEQYSLEPVF